MKYIVVSCAEREITLEAVRDTFAEAYQVMKDEFIEHHRKSRMPEEEVEEMLLEIESYPDVATSDYGFHSGSNEAYAWSNVDTNCNYDIKIFEVN